jgi:hypothetical protein
MKGQRLSLWDERRHPSMGFFCIDSFLDDTETFSHSEDMGINWEGFPSHAKKKETVDGFGTDPFQASHGFFDFFRTHPF